MKPLTLLPLLVLTACDKSTPLTDSRGAGSGGTGESHLYVVHDFPLPLRAASPGLADSKWAPVIDGLDPEAVRKLLTVRWPVPTDPGLKLLREKFLTYKPTAIVTYNGKDYLQLDHPAQAADPDNGGSYFVAFPVPPTELEAAMIGAAAVHGEHVFLSPSFIEFHSLFPDLREDFRTAGNFILPEEWNSIHKEMNIGLSEANWESYDELGEWKHALNIYHARNGDMVALSRTGAVAWYRLSENEIVPIANDFSGFLRYFTGYIDKRWPLDSFGPSDDE